MADETPVTMPVEAQEPTTTTEPLETTKPDEDVAVAPAEENGVADIDALPVKDAAAGEAPASADVTSSITEVSTDVTLTGKDKKRKSTGGVPEHKNKKLNKKKSMLSLHLDCKPGEFYWARLKGYPPWPSVICDESMLPESLLATRPVSTARPDGTIRADFEEGGKNAKERTFPIMFLSTNEFQWMINTSLTPLDPEDVKAMPTAKMPKSLQAAYEVVAEDHDLQFFKNILLQWQEETEALAEAEAAAQAEADRVAAERKAILDGEGDPNAKPAKKKAARKSKAADGDEEMEDVDVPKSSKKRKKVTDSDTETPKPKKTPKITKLNAPKTPNGEGSAAKPKSKKKVVTAPKPEDKDEPQAELSDAEKFALRQKTVLYLRHRLQKGFLTRDKAPAESEMADMNTHLSTLEGYQDLEVQIIKETKIHKVLKGIVKLNFIPRDDEFSFKKRSSALLEIWNQRIDAAGDVPAKSALAGDDDKAQETNGETNADSAPGLEEAVQEDEAEAADHPKEIVNGDKVDLQTEKAEEQMDAKTTDNAPAESPADQATDPIQDVDGNMATE